MLKNVKIVTFFNTYDFRNDLIPVSFDLGDWIMYLCRSCLGSNTTLILLPSWASLLLCPRLLPRPR